jgi:hypothetical protein
MLGSLIMGDRPMDSAGTRRVPPLGETAVKAAITHTTTYFVCGLVALNLFDYASLFASEGYSAFMRPATDPQVATGLLFQPLRGALFGLCFYAIRDVVFGRSRGWLIMWLLLAVIGIVNPFGPAPGSIEGLIYTKLPWRSQLGGGLVEVLSQSLLFSIGLFYWVTLPARQWLGWGLTALAALAILASVAAMFLG